MVSCARAALALFPVILAACGKRESRTEQIPAAPEYELIPADASETAAPQSSALNRLTKPDWKWKETLTDLQFRVTREGETEPRFTGNLHKESKPGSYHCVCCDTLIFTSRAKYPSDFGWPTFRGPVSDDIVITKTDDTAFRQRIAVQCRKCEAHLGHVFEDGPPPEGNRYNINASALRFVPEM